MAKIIILLAGLFIFIQQTPLYAFKVAIFDFDDRLEHPVTTAKYIEEKLKRLNNEIQVEQFSGKKDTAFSIKLLHQLDNSNYDLLITITSDALIIANHIIEKTPTLFTNVNNPLSLGFQTLGPPGRMISGASYYISVEKQLMFYKKILPGLTKIGFIFDQQNKSKKAELPEARRTCEKMGLLYGIEVVASEKQLRKAAARLIKEGAQAISIGSSDLLYDHISVIIDICDSSYIPVLSFNKDGVKHGAIAALASDYNLMVDELIIPMATRVLNNGISPGEMPIAFLKNHLIFINSSHAKKLKLNISKKILDQAIILE
jgi:putative tryptophan/tyrosine transport system substrate-binding protein